ncbi:MAG TPA: hypothetical protein VGE05_04930, partial [Novosphingobium sp.]
GTTLRCGALAGRARCLAALRRGIPRGFVHAGVAFTGLSIRRIPWRPFPDRAGADRTTGDKRSEGLSRLPHPSRFCQSGNLTERNV